MDKVDTLITKIRQLREAAPTNSTGAGLVCNKHADNQCINPCRGSTSGDTWEKRLEFLNKALESYESPDD